MEKRRVLVCDINSDMRSMPLQILPGRMMLHWNSDSPQATWSRRN